MWLYSTSQTSSRPTQRWFWLVWWPFCTEGMLSKTLAVKVYSRTHNSWHLTTPIPEWACPRWGTWTTSTRSYCMTSSQSRSLYCCAKSLSHLSKSSHQSNLQKAHWIQVSRHPVTLTLSLTIQAWSRISLWEYSRMMILLYLTSWIRA